MNYDNLFLPADDFAASQRFYGETLGLPVKFTFPELGMTAYRVGDEEAAIILKDRQRYPDALPAIWIAVDNVAETYAALRERVAFRSEPFRIRTGWAVEVTDPAGNLLGFTDYRD